MRLCLLLLLLFAAPLGAEDRKSDALTAGLRWLARHQSADGSWKAAGFTEGCSGAAPCAGVGFADYDPAATGLALLAFLGAGYTQLTRERYVDPVTQRENGFGAVVDKGLSWLIAHQAADGCMSPRVAKLMYNHAIATLTLCEAFGITAAEPLRAPSGRAVAYLIAARNPTGGWRYSPLSGDSDTSVTAWCVMALKSAQLGGLVIDVAALDGALKHIQDVTEANYGKVGYLRLEDAGVKVCVPGKNEDFANHETMAAIGMIVRQFVGKNRRDPMLDLGAKLLAVDLPRWDLQGKTNDYYYWYFGSLALFLFDGPGGSGRYWGAWHEAQRKALIEHQETGNGCVAGSWSADDRWGFEGGRVYATALSLLTLEK